MNNVKKNFVKGVKISDKDLEKDDNEEKDNQHIGTEIKNKTCIYVSKSREETIAKVEEYNKKIDLIAKIVKGNFKVIVGSI
jgi:hypothetical protein